MPRREPVAESGGWQVHCCPTSTCSAGSCGRNCELRRVSNGPADPRAFLSVLRPPAVLAGAAANGNRLPGRALPELWRSFD
jgi:hypothetical protein